MLDKQEPRIAFPTDIEGLAGDSAGGEVGGGHRRLQRVDESARGVRITLVAKAPTSTEAEVRANLLKIIHTFIKRAAPLALSHVPT